MSDKEHKLVREFLKIAKENNFCYTVCFTMGALAFNKGNDEKKTIEILEDIIKIIKKHPQEDDFVNQINKKYFSK